MKEQVKEVIDGIEYGLYPISPFKSAPVLTRLLKVFGTSLLKIIIGATKNDKKSSGKSLLDSDMSEVLPQLTEGLESLFEKIGENDIEYFAKKLLCEDHFFADGKKINNLDIYMQDKSVFHLLKLVKFSLMANYKDFLAGNLDGAS